MRATVEGEPDNMTKKLTSATQQTFDMTAGFDMNMHTPPVVSNAGGVLSWGLGLAPF